MLLASAAGKFFLSFELDFTGIVRYAYWGIAAGLFCIAFAADVIDTALTADIKLEAMTIALFASSGFILLLEVLKAFYGKPQTTAVDMIIIALSFYILLYHNKIKKRAKKFYNEDENNE